MNYNLKILSYSDFQVFDAAVQACFDLSRRVYKTQLVSVTDDWQDLPKEHHQYMQEKKSLGTTMDETGNHQIFHTWVNPQFIRPSYKFYHTLVHELCHGYAGLQYGHAAHWRRWFYRVSWHLDQAKLMPKPASPLPMLCWNVEYIYNRKSENMMGTVLEAHKRAEEEHEQFLVNFEKRKAALA